MYEDAHLEMAYEDRFAMPDDGYEDNGWGPFDDEVVVEAVSEITVGDPKPDGWGQQFDDWGYPIG